MGILLLREKQGGQTYSVFIALVSVSQHESHSSRLRPFFCSTILFCASIIETGDEEKFSGEDGQCYEVLMNTRKGEAHVYKANFYLRNTGWSNQCRGGNG